MLGCFFFCAEIFSLLVDERQRLPRDNHMFFATETLKARVLFCYLYIYTQTYMCISI